MRYLFLILFFSVSFFVSFGQGTPNRASCAVTAYDCNLGAVNSFRIPIFNDTIQPAANVDSIGILMYRKIDSAVYVRVPAGGNIKKWVKLLKTGNAINSVSWGQIIGTLSNQTDLMNALNLKADQQALTDTSAILRALIEASVLSIKTLYNADDTLKINEFDQRQVFIPKNGQLLFNGLDSTETRILNGSLSSGLFSQITSNYDYSSIQHNNSSGEKSILLPETEAYTGIRVRDDMDSKGMVYDGDYSDNQIADTNAIPSVKAVKRLITDSSLTANNGLSKSGSNIVLGQDYGDGSNPAALSGYREIPIRNYALVLTGTGGVAGAQTQMYGSSVTVAGDSTNNATGAVNIGDITNPGKYLELRGFPAYGSVSYDGGDNIKMLPNASTEIKRLYVTDSLNIGKVSTGLSTDSVLVKGTDAVVRKVAQNNEIDVFIDAGQSNAEGSGDSTLSITPPSGVAFQYYKGLKALKDPVGTSTWGSAWPAFATTYYAITGRKICFVPTARGASTQTIASDWYNSPNNWDSTGPNFPRCIDSLNKALAALRAAGYKPVIKGVLWNQGEGDGRGITLGLIDSATYRQALLKMVKRFRDTLGYRIPFYILRSGYYTYVYEPGMSQVRDVQTKAPNMGDSLIYCVYYNTIDFFKRGYLKNDSTHYNQFGLNEMGRIAAEQVIASTSFNWQTQNRNVYFELGNVGIGERLPAAQLSIKQPFSYSQLMPTLRIADNKDTSLLEFRGQYATDGSAIPDVSIFIGPYSGMYNVKPSGSNNGAHQTALGYKALHLNTTGGYNTAIGQGVLRNNLTGSFNTAVGERAIETATAAANTVAIGQRAFQTLTSGNGNCAIGTNAGDGFTAGDKNTFIGTSAGSGSVSGRRNIFIGYRVGNNAGAVDRRLMIHDTTVAFPMIYAEFDNNILATPGSFGINTKTPGPFGLKVERSVAINKDSTTSITSYGSNMPIVIDTATGKLQKATVGIQGRNGQSGTTYTVLTSDLGKVIGLTNTAARTITLPLANSVPSGFIFWIKDEAGNALSGNITINRSGSDTIDGATSTTMSVNYQVRGFYSNGGTGWFIL